MPLTGWDAGPIQEVQQESAWRSTPARTKSVGGWNAGSLNSGSASFPNITNGASSAMGNSALSRFLAKNSFANVMAATQARMQAAIGDASSTSGATGGGATMGNPSGGNWANVNQWNNQITAAIARVRQEFGISVPANVVKAVMELESGGVNVGMNNAGYGGLMQVGPGSNVANYDSGYAATPEGNIYYGVQELANWYKVTKSWDTAPLAYFSGYNYNKPYVSDGHYTVADYQAHIARNMQALNGATQGSYGSTASGSGWSGGGGALKTMMPSGNISYAFGEHSDNGLYGYGTSYGLDGAQHAGLDVSQPLGSKLYAPGNATVVCVGCWRNDHLTNGVGRIELELPNGTRILYDHTNLSYVQVGQKVQAGTLLGTSGGMYVPHTHLEVRVPDSSQSSGYRLVDPVAFFSGSGWGGGSSPTTQGLFAGQPGQKMTALDRAKQIVWGF